MESGHKKQTLQYAKRLKTAAFTPVRLFALLIRMATWRYTNLSSIV